MLGYGGEPYILKQGLKGYLFPHLSKPHVHAQVLFFPAEFDWSATYIIDLLRENNVWKKNTLKLIHE